MDKMDSISNKTYETAGQVALPFNEDQFKDFIVSLLGKPQTITKRFRGSFEIDKTHIITLFELLNQRVYQQNDASLIQFLATVYYDDNSTVTLNGFEHLVHYNETLPIVSKGLHLTWKYLIKFRDKETFEKQEISVSFIADTDEIPSFDEDSDVRHYPMNNVNIRIQHTARTWGADIEGLLSKHIKTLVKEESDLMSSFRYNPERVENVVSAILVFITLGFTTYSVLKQRTEALMDNTMWLHYYANIFFLFISTFILVKATLIFLDTFEFDEKPSFILLTKQAIVDKEKTLKNYKYNLRKYLLTIIISLTFSVLGNYIYTFLTSK